jgi:hypothetical protein
MCPNCQIPLAPDRIQGEFPSVAHLSSSAEGRMTIKDVLRETASNGANAEDMSLDDKVQIQKSKLFGDFTSIRAFFKRLTPSSRPGSSTIIQRLALITVALCMSSIVFLSFRSVTPKHAIITNSSKNAAVSAQPVLTADQKQLLALVPVTAGEWTRNERVSDILNYQSSGQSAVRTTLSTYRNGAEYAEMWLVKAPSLPFMSQLQNFEGAPRAVHTSDGVIYIKPVSAQPADINYLKFDFVPTHPNDAYSIVTNQPFVSNLPHTTSWYQSPYVITIAARTAGERDDFFDAIARLPH